MKSFFLMILAYAIIAIVGMVLLSVFSHINFLREIVHIFYYRMLYYAIIIHILLLAIYGVVYLAVVKIRTFFSTNVVFSGLIISALFSFLFITAGPMTIDRSYTIFSIAYMYEHPERIYSQQDIEDTFWQEYIINKQGMRRRLDEQLSIGNIERVEEGYRITSSGKRMIEFMRFVEVFFPVDERRTIFPLEDSQ